MKELLLRLFLLSILIVLVGLGPRSHQVFQELQQAQRALSLGAQQDASNHLTDAASQLPWRADLWEMSGHYALKVKDYQAAIRYLEKAAKDGGPSTPGGLSLQGFVDLGDAYLQSGDSLGAISAWEKGLTAIGPTAGLLERLAQTHIDLVDFPGAISDTRALVDLQPEDAQLRFQLGLLIATQNPEAALEPLAKSSELDPSLEQSVSKLRRGILSGRVSDDPAYALLVTGRALASQEEWQMAAEAFRQATLVRPDYAEAWAYLGEARQHFLEGDGTSNPDSADGPREILKALQLDPQSLAAHTFLALYWTRKGRYDLALEAVQAAHKLDPENPVLQVEVADTLAASGHLSEAYQAYLDAIDLSPRDPTYSRYLVDFSLNYNYQVEQVALPIVRRLIIQDSGSAENLDLMAQVLIKLGDLDNAKRNLSRALQSDPNYAPAHLHLGLVYILTGDKSSAQQEFNFAASLAPQTPIADQAHRLMETYFP